ncbi:uncharacterized protein LOC134280180 [Saccostrea cucullata]|uniref:uncharacterized protein LOC134280180 n=1 Tax=Saccostrea cuccullata TaxID=36930 RepID=UPI002ED2F47E
MTITLSLFVVETIGRGIEDLTKFKTSQQTNQLDRFLRRKRNVQYCDDIQQYHETGFNINHASICPWVNKLKNEGRQFYYEAECRCVRPNSLYVINDNIRCVEVFKSLNFEKVICSGGTSLDLLIKSPCALSQTGSSPNTPEMLALFLTLLFVPFNVYGLDCSGLPDGNYEIGCRSYGVCAGGVVKIVDCGHGKVYDNSTGTCAEPSTVQGICGQTRDCSNKADGLYADTETHCKTYYTCYQGVFDSHNFCSKVTVFDEAQQTCNWPDAVDPPCGTKGMATSSTG